MVEQIRKHYYKGDELFLECSKCKEIRSCREFSKDKTKRFGFNGRCKNCDKKHSREYRLSNREKVAKQKKEYYETHKEQWRRAKKEYYTRKKNEGINIKGIHKKTRKYIKDNKLRINVCAVCGDDCKASFHHIDYNKWNYGVFVCTLCHNNIHAGHINCPEPVDLVQLNAHMPVILTDKDLELCNI